jgi:valyl-tRNA synthetase
MIDGWPRFDARFSAEREAASTMCAIDVIKAIRNLRSEMKVPPSKKANCVFAADGAAAKEALEEGRAYIERLAGLYPFAICDERGGIAAGNATIVVGGIQVYLPLGELVDVAKETARLGKELAAIDGEIKRAAGRLNNPGFISKAPAAIINEESEKLKTYEGVRLKIADNLKKLSGV